MGRQRKLLAVAALLGAAAVGTAADAGGGRTEAASCRPLRLSSGYVRGVQQATRAGQDLWGNALLRGTGGPSYRAAHSLLKPLLLVGGPLHAGPLTDSGVYYLAFGRPDGVAGRGPIALHLADGSEIVSDRSGGPKLALDVGSDGRERYGSCLARLSTPRLYGGYYPILETEYVDGNGVRFRQESFVARVPQTGSLVSFVRLNVDVPKGAAAEKIRFTPSESGSGERRAAGPRRRHLPLSATAGTSPGRPSSSTWAPPGRSSSRGPSARRRQPLTLDDRTYEQARRSVTAYWDGRLAGGATFVVPEPRVLDAERNLLIQNLLMTWRYSLGNAYEAFEFPESLENATVLGEYGFGGADRAIVEESFNASRRHLYPQLGGRHELLAAAGTTGSSRPAPSSRGDARPAAARGAARAGQRRPAAEGTVHRGPHRRRSTGSRPGRGVAGPSGITRSGPRRVRGDLAAGSRLAARLRRPPRGGDRVRATAARRVALHPGPAAGRRAPIPGITGSRHGSYWNLVVPDALASGFFPPHGPEASGALDYMLGHGSRLLGLVRGDAKSLYTAREPSFGHE